MKAGRLKRYRFATWPQWKVCLFTAADRNALEREQRLQTYPAFEATEELHRSKGANAPCATRNHGTLWCDDEGMIHRLTAFSDKPEVRPPPPGLAKAERIVAVRNSLWTIAGSPPSLHRFDAESLSRRLKVDASDARLDDDPETKLVDVSTGARDSVWALAHRKGNWKAFRFDRAGREIECVVFPGASDVRQFAYLRRPRKFVLLSGGSHPRLCWHSAKDGRPLFSIAVGGLRPCFKAHQLGSDSNDRIFLAGEDGEKSPGASHVVVIYADGTPLSRISLGILDEPVRGVAAGQEGLLVAGKQGLVQFKPSESIAVGAEASQCRVMTPMLFSPDREDQRRWLRIEATASLPDGCKLELHWASTDKEEVRDRLSAFAADESIPANQRFAGMLSDPDVNSGRTSFLGTGDPTTPNENSYAAKLFDVKHRFLWAFATLTAAPGVRRPYLAELAVLYPGRTLMEDLPAIYQAEEDRPDSFLRSFVGVLETTTQGLDARIQSLGSRILTSTDDERWLDFIAEWLGVPWDDSLKRAQKQAILKRASELAKGRGTRVGLEALLESVIPGPPRRFRITDANADFGFAMVGCGNRPGSALPAMLAWSKRPRARLDTQLILGSTRLPCGARRDDDHGPLAGTVRIDVAASASERIAWEPWLGNLIAEFVPLTARTDLRWVAPQALKSNRLDGSTTIEPEPSSLLGTDAFVGRTRLPTGGARLSETGPTIKTQLQ